MKNKTLFIILGTILFLIIIESSILIIRAANPIEIDDVHPDIYCQEKRIKEADILWIIPKFNGTSIEENKTWCEEMVLTGKKLGLHGFEHTYHEFGNESKTEELQEAIDIFRKCFGYEPTMFKPPQHKLSTPNRRFLEDRDIEIIGSLNSLFHKVYHCGNSGYFSNNFIETF
jgi:predicted deacetylase